VEKEEDRLGRAEGEIDEMHRSIGRYFVEFSRLFFWMKRAMSAQLDGKEAPLLTDLLLGEATAQQLANSYFGICRSIGDYNEAEEQIAACMRREVNEQIEERNIMAHGDWWVGWGPGDAEKLDDPRLQRVKPMHKDNPLQSIDYSIPRLEAMSDELKRLRALVGEFGDIILQQRLHTPDARVALNEKAVRPGDVFELIGTRKTGFTVRRTEEAERTIRTLSYE
jgi:hypothetical protein